jgi:hypothetical protein
MPVRIDVENGGFKVKGTKILVLPKYKKDAQQTYEEFRKMTIQTKHDDFDVQMNDDDATAVNTNTQGNEIQLQAMFDHEQFADLTEPTMPDNSPGSTNAGGQGLKARTNEKNEKRSKLSNSSRLDNKKRVRESPTRSNATRANATSPARSYSSVAGGTAASSSDGTRPNQPQREKTEIQELKDMMQRLLTLMMQTQMEASVYRREATSSANMVQ